MCYLQCYCFCLSNLLNFPKISSLQKKNYSLCRFYTRKNIDFTMLEEPIVVYYVQPRRNINDCNFFKDFFFSRILDKFKFIHHYFFPFEACLTLYSEREF